MVVENSVLGMLGKVLPYLPNIIFIIVIITAMFFANAVTNLIYRKLTKRFGVTSPIAKMLIKTAIYAIGTVMIILNIPGMKSDVLQLIGLVFGGIIAFSSSTIIANGMSGILIRVIGQYHIGDVVEFEGSLGKVTEIKAFHTEIETVDRTLLTIPNNVMMSQKFTNFTERGCIVHADVSIGYDIARTQVEKLLLKAAHTVGLEKTFVSVMGLGDYSINYRVNGILKDAGLISGARSALHKEILDEFNKAKVEIVSPMFNAVRNVPEDKMILADYVAEETTAEILAREQAIEHEIFEKAEKEEKIMKQKEQMTTELKQMIEQQENLEKAIKNVKDDKLKERLKQRKEQLDKDIEEKHQKVRKQDEKTEKV